MHFGSLRNADQWPGNLQPMADLSKCSGLNGDRYLRTNRRSVDCARMPLTFSNLQVKRQHSMVQYAGRDAILIRLDTWQRDIIPATLQPESERDNTPYGYGFYSHAPLTQNIENDGGSHFRIIGSTKLVTYSILKCPAGGS